MSKRRFGFTVTPHFGKVLAEVYREYIPKNLSNKDPLHIQVHSKEFGGGFFGFKDAREWAKNILIQIYHANKD